MKKPLKSAAALMAELQCDPEFVARNHERESQQKTNLKNYFHVAEPVLKELNALGFQVQTIGDLRQGKVEYREAIPVLLYWLPRIPNPQVKEDIIRMLSVPWAGPAVASALIEEFPNAESEGMRWALANGLAVTANDKVFEELLQLISDTKNGSAREMLVLALGNVRDSRAVVYLLDMLNDEQVVGHAVMALGELKAPAARVHLKRLTQHPIAWIRTEAKKALRKIDESQSH